MPLLAPEPPSTRARGTGISSRAIPAWAPVLNRQFVASRLIAAGRRLARWQDATASLSLPTIDDARHLQNIGKPSDRHHSLAAASGSLSWRGARCAQSMETTMNKLSIGLATAALVISGSAAANH